MVECKVKTGKKGGMTALELIITLVLLMALVSLAMAGYQRYRDHTAMLVDETNQKVLQAAVKLYAYDNNALPGSLSELRSKDLGRAYAEVTKGGKPYTILTYLKESLGIVEMAEAVVLPGKYYNSDINILTCPSDPTPPAKGGVSYALAPGWVNRPLRDLLSPDHADEPLILEADDVRGGVVYRHGFFHEISVHTTVRGERRKQEKDLFRRRR